VIHDHVGAIERFESSEDEALLVLPQL